MHSGDSDVEASKHKQSEDLYLDFRGVKVGNMKINEHEVIADFRDHHVHLPIEYLKPNGENKV